jgi:hypothetical protein
MVESTFICDNLSSSFIVLLVRKGFSMKERNDKGIIFGRQCLGIHGNGKWKY